MKITTNMKGFQQWIKEHPKKCLSGYFRVGNRELTHKEVVRMVEYAVAHGYRTEADIPSDEYAIFLDRSEGKEEEE